MSTSGRRPEPSSSSTSSTVAAAPTASMATARSRAAEPGNDEREDHYSSDPERPVPFITEPTFAQIGGPDDYRPVERRDDVLVYTTEPLAEDTEVTGPVRARLFAASSASGYRLHRQAARCLARRLRPETLRRHGQGPVPRGNG